jgi:hypothetical protein
MVIRRMRKVKKKKKKRVLSRVRALAMVEARWLKRHRYDLVEVHGV